jgi:hypothetical protein
MGTSLNLYTVPKYFIILNDMIKFCLNPSAIMRELIVLLNRKLSKNQAILLFSTVSFKKYNGKQETEPVNSVCSTGIYHS